MGTVHFIDRRPRVSLCVRCGCKMLVGITEGLPVKVDPLPLTLEGEMFALMQGRWTYGMTVGGILYHRNPGRIRTDTKHGHPMLVTDHRCWQALVSAIDASRVRQITGYMERSERGGDPEHEESLFTIKELLSGRIVEINDNNGSIPF